MELTNQKYRVSEVGIIPVEWEVMHLGDIANVIGGGTPSTFNDDYWNGDINWFTPTEIGLKKYSYESIRKITKKGLENSSARVLPIGTILLTSRAGIGDVSILMNEACTNQGFQSLVATGELNNEFLYYVVSTLKKVLLQNASGSTFLEISPKKVKSIHVALPSTLIEQTAIATALSDTDTLIGNLEKLIAKKRNIKQGAMQGLLTGKRRLKGFNYEWAVKSLSEVIDCLDNLRIPLNESQRASMKGDYPYCGANGILDYIDDYCIDDEFILIAEDGGYFDEYMYRPIAYKMSGKCWVNNHAHILKAKENYNQDYIYYSLVHKNILRFLTSGTRAKLNKSEMYNIEIDISPSKNEQTAIADILTDMDAEIETLEQKLNKYRMIKQGMMQVLLTGKIRLNH